MGIPLKLIASFLGLAISLPLQGSLWDFPDKEIDGWKYFNGYGWIKEAQNGWVYHLENGWTYAVGDSPESIWFHNKDIGWIWSENQNYPLIYSPTARDWFFCHPESSLPQNFFAYGQNSWIPVYSKDPSPPVLSQGSYLWKHREYFETPDHELLSWTRNFVTTELDTHIIENDLIRVTLLPDWGARILSIYYKPQHMELLSYAKGDKFSDIIYTEGAFYYDNWLLLPGGINPTFPEGEHGKYWGEIWDFETIEKSSTHTTVRMSRTDDIDWAGHPGKFNNGLTGMRVDMDITVYSNRASVEISYTLTNTKNETLPYEFWMAASLAPLPPELSATSSNLEIVMKQEKILVKDWWNWMKAVETDDNSLNDDVYLFDKLAWLYNWQGSGIGYAYPLTDNPWWGVINHDYDWGVLRTADDATVSPGMKIWGTGANYGMFELWSGNSSEFFEDAYLAPLEVKSWKEYFIPTIDLSGVSHANSHGAVQASVTEGDGSENIDLSVFSTWQPANWKLEVFALIGPDSRQSLFTDALSFTPVVPTQHRTIVFLNEILPAEPFAYEAVLTDLFSGEERLRLTIGL